jgi:hypothetical protein
MSIKIGIIGFGEMGKIRYDAINQVGMGEFIAISDPKLSILE